MERRHESSDEAGNPEHSREERPIYQPLVTEILKSLRFLRAVDGVLEDACGLPIYELSDFYFNLFIILQCKRRQHIQKNI
jgi:hypothetical protein